MCKVKYINLFASACAIIGVGFVLMSRPQSYTAVSSAGSGNNNAIIGSASPAKHFTSLNDMFQDADLVVIARVIQSSPATLVPDPTPLPKLQEAGGVPGVLLTESTLEIEQVFKGNAQPATWVTVIQTGGMVDGRLHYLEGDPLFEPGERNVLFLKRVPDAAVGEASKADKYILNGTPQARFKLVEGRVVPMVNDSLTQAIAPLSSDDFIQQVAKLATRE